MKDVPVSVDQNDLSSFPDGRVNLDRVDATSEQEIQDQIDHDNRVAMAEMGEYTRAVRARVGISVDTLRNWEQGRRYPTGTARALLRIIDKAPEVAVAALQKETEILHLRHENDPREVLRSC
jgi:putative transcriptional regulator